MNLCGAIAGRLIKKKGQNKPYFDSPFFARAIISLGCLPSSAAAIRGQKRGQFLIRISGRHPDTEVFDPAYFRKETEPRPLSGLCDFQPFCRYEIGQPKENPTQVASHFPNFYLRRHPGSQRGGIPPSDPGYSETANLPSL